MRPTRDVDERGPWCGKLSYTTTKMVREEPAYTYILKSMHLLIQVYLAIYDHIGT